MSEFFAAFSTLNVFLGIAAIGFVFLLVSLIFGDMFEHFGDHELTLGGPSFFSVRILSVFVTAFGGFGAIGVHYGLSTLPSYGVGFGCGILFAWLIYMFARFLHRGRKSGE